MVPPLECDWPEEDGPMGFGVTERLRDTESGTLEVLSDFEVTAAAIGPKNDRSKFSSFCSFFSGLGAVCCCEA